jgi:hypothetical protein
VSHRAKGTLAIIPIQDNHPLAPFGNIHEIACRVATNNPNVTKALNFVLIFAPLALPLLHPLESTRAAGSDDASISVSVSPDGIGLLALAGWCRANVAPRILRLLIRNVFGRSFVIAVDLLLPLLFYRRLGHFLVHHDVLENQTSGRMHFHSVEPTLQPAIRVCSTDLWSSRFAPRT